MSYIQSSKAIAEVLKKKKKKERENYTGQCKTFFQFRKKLILFLAYPVQTSRQVPIQATSKKHK